MKVSFFLIVVLFAIQPVKAQDAAHPNENRENIYRASAPKINDLIHTKLEVSFDFKKSRMYGKAWITLKPHFYATDTLTLDAKGMDIKELALYKGNATSTLKYRYDSMQLFIKLDKVYNRNEEYTIYINYTARPNEITSKGSEAITDDKGLYFINPTGNDIDKPTELWTQGETESNSIWMPTIDKPNQKSTEEIFMTVPDKFVTLSNGVLKSQKKNADGTRTDYWKLDLPNASYLFFMGAGDFSVVKDKYKDKEVSYYVEKQYEPYARQIFGNTPEMMKFFSDNLGIDFPWPKYSQMVARDYVSGAMENTTATLHQEGAYQNARQLTDGNAWEGTIAHELFHQWFGDLVTAESWSNLTVNESFANYGEYLWYDYKYGKDAADEHIYEDMEGYLTGENEKKDLVRFRYADREDMFDAVSYNKGGCILHMLRNYVGTDAFYKSLNNYLNANKFKNGEADQLRLAFEDVTGEDMNWLWNQWYYGSGHPKLKINYKYDDARGHAFVIIEQTQNTGKIFRLPIDIDVYNGATKTRKKVWIENKIDTFIFNYTKHPDLINADAEKILLCEKTDNKTTDNFIHQIKYAPNYLDRRESIEYFADKELKELTLGLNDKFAGLRRLTIEKLSKSKLSTSAEVLESVEKIALSEKDKKTKAAAISLLAASGHEKYVSLYLKNIDDSSYSVAGACLEGLMNTEPEKAYALAKKYSTDARGDLGDEISKILLKEGKEDDFNFIITAYGEMQNSVEKLELTDALCNYLVKLKDLSKIKKGIDGILKYRAAIGTAYLTYTEPAFKYWMQKISKAKGGEVAEYIYSEFK